MLTVLNHFILVSVVVLLIACSPESAQEKQLSQQESPNQVVSSAIQEEKTTSAKEAKEESLPDPIVESKLIKESQVKDLMGTYVGVDVCVAEDQVDSYNSAMEKIWEVLGELHWRMSTYSDKGDVYDINRSNGEPVVINNDTYYVLTQAKHFYELSEGAFDITVAPLIDFWKDMSKRGEFPLSREVSSIKKSIGMKHIKFNDEETAVTISSPELKIDLGGIAKGFAIDEAVRILHEHDLYHFLIDAGGDVYVGGQNCENKVWQIGIRDPKNPTGLHGVVKVSDLAVTTSGDYEQFFSIKGQRLSHIINPITGYPQKGVISSTVIAPSALEADALSTSLMVLGPQKGIELIDELGERYAALILFQSNPNTGIEVFPSALYSKYKVEK